jgi:integrase
VHTVGKGRKERRTPLIPATKTILKAWLNQTPGAPTDPLFPAITGGRLSRDAIERRLAQHVATAAATCPSLKGKRVTMHMLRHTAAMRLLVAGNDVTVIALWLGHFSGVADPYRDVSAPGSGRGFCRCFRLPCVTCVTVRHDGGIACGRYGWS